MSGMMDKIKGAVSKDDGGNTQSGSTGGSGMDSKVDNAANQGMNKAMGDAGVPQSDDSKIDKVADGQINKEL